MQNQAAISKRILIVENEPAMRELLQDALIGYGFSVSIAVTLLEVQKVIKDEPIDLILSDILLTNPQSSALWSFLRANPHQQDTPVIFMTSYLPTPSQFFSSVLFKPFTFDSLLRSVRMVLG